MPPVIGVLATATAWFILAGGYLVAVLGGDLLVRGCIRSLRVPQAVAEGGLRSFGKYVGWTERFLFVTLMVSGNAAIIGWIIAAKFGFRLGQMRFEDMRDKESRALAEYFFLGSLLSLTVAVFVGLVTQILILRL